MADTDEKKEKKPEKSQQSGKPEKADKAEKAAKAAKGEQGGKGAKAAKPEKGEKGKAAPDGKGEKAAAPAAPREPEPKVPARLKVQFEETIRGKLAEQFGYKNRYADSGARQDRRQHGHRRRRCRPQEGGIGRRRSRAYRRTEGGDHQGAQIDRHLQAARRPSRSAAR